MSVEIRMADVSMSQRARKAIQRLFLRKRCRQPVFMHELSVLDERDFDYVNGCGPVTKSEILGLIEQYCGDGRRMALQENEMAHWEWL